MRAGTVLAGFGWACLMWAGCGSAGGGLRDASEARTEDPGPSLGRAPDGGAEPAPAPVQPVIPRAKCSPTADGPYWIEEGEALAFTARCGTGRSSGATRFELVFPPEGASLDPHTGAFSWTPALDQAAVYQLGIRDAATGDVGSVKIGVADAFDHPDNEPLADPLTYTEEYGLPVFHLSYESLSLSEYGPASVIYRGHPYAVTAKFRGATSAGFPKRSYTIEFPDTDEFSDPAVGFGNRDKLVLITSFNDVSYVRSALAFALWRRMDPGNIAVNTFHAVVYVNGRYWGLYTASDHIDSDLMKRSGLNKQGNLYKAVDKDANFSLDRREGDPKRSLAEGYEKKAGFPEEGEPGAFDDLEVLTEFVGSAPRATFRDQIRQYVHLRDYENWWILMTLILGYDSVSKNAYHYHDPNGGPFRFIPWDLDATLGQAWDTRRSPPRARPDFTVYNHLFARMLEEPAIADPLRERYLALLTGPLAREEVLALVDELAAGIRPVALRDERRWGETHRSYSLWDDRDDFLSHPDEIAYLRAWIAERWDSLLNEGLP
jgi:CotH kinase protein